VQSDSVCHKKNIRVVLNNLEFYLKGSEVNTQTKIEDTVLYCNNMKKKLITTFNLLSQ